jgi:hypothetical protein
MDYKWDAVVDGDRLSLHRSWTGYGLYEAQFAHDDDGWRITDLRVCGDRGLYRRGTDDYEAGFVVYLINAYLLGEGDPDAWARLKVLREQPYPAVAADAAPESGEHTGADRKHHPQ